MTWLTLARASISLVGWSAVAVGGMLVMVWVSRWVFLGIFMLAHLYSQI
ncbi:MAG: hypothetical protein K2X72_02610 [Reyranella sp.]|nr:hypothetical protein [Reyranella sp.]